MKLFFKKILSDRNTIKVSNGLDPDQDRHSVSPDLGSNCVQRLSADDKRKIQFSDQLVQYCLCLLYVLICKFSLFV